jgi:hypothetical protein
MILCRSCGMETDGEDVCGFCLGFKTHGNDEEAATAIDYGIGQVARSVSGLGYQDNPGAVSGENTFTVEARDAARIVELNDWLIMMIGYIYESAPEKSSASEFRKFAANSIRLVTDRVRKYFDPERKGFIPRGPLVVIDGSIEEGGREASGYLGILKVLHGQWHILHRRFKDEFRGKLEDADAVAYLMFARVGNLITIGELGADKPYKKKRKWTEGPPV